jgi:hypothetical protein
VRVDHFARGKGRIFVSALGRNAAVSVVIASEVAGVTLNRRELTSCSKIDELLSSFFVRF